jgi:alkylation response protein AidB-like acyl-CoA dehydrogenase
MNNDAESILNAAIVLAPMIKESRDEIERERRLPMHIVEAMKESGVFRMPMPRALGGPELDVPSQLRVLEALAVADASVGWCAMIGCEAGYYLGYVDQAVAREIFTDIDMVVAGALTLTGRAERVKGGYRLSGRWPFSSGCQHSSWMVAGCIVHENGTQKLRPTGVPESRQCFVPAKEAKILDTWYTSGLRGSGSHDFTIDDCFVPEERTFSYQDLKLYRSEPLYRFPFNVALKLAGPALGVARAAIDALIEAGQRPVRLTTIGGSPVPPRTLRDEEFVQDAVGRAEAILGAARGYLFATVSDIWETMKTTGEPSPPQLAHFAMLNTQVFKMCTEAVELTYKARGGSAVYTGNFLDRCLRDMLTMNQHVMNSLRSYSMAGRILLGLPPEQYLF